MARVGYAKIGRSYNLDASKATSIGGDIDVLNMLKRLALRYPEHEFVLIGKNSGENPQDLGYPPNVTNPWTEWKKNWMVVPDPVRADLMIEHFRAISGDMHETLDHMIVWAGQHGSANSRIPMIGSDWLRPPGAEWVATGHENNREFHTTNDHNDDITGGEGSDVATAQFSFVHYVSWVLDFVSRWREAGPGPLFREEIWLCPDPRNYLKCREKRWPLRYPVIAQYDFLKYHKSERYGRFPESLNVLDPTGYREDSRWVSNVAYCYGGLELSAVGAPEAITFDPRPGSHRLGMVVNENLTGVKDARLGLLEDWVFPNFEDVEVRGHWTEKSQLKLGRVINPVPYTEVLSVMKSFATTITTPASGSGWATTKPWEAFAIGSVCFFHPRYDDQGHVLPLKDGSAGQALVSEDSKMLAQYLRVESAEQLKERVDEVTSNPDLYHALVTAQRRHYEASFDHWRGGTRSVGDRITHDLARVDEGTIIPDTTSFQEPWLNYTDPVAAKVQSRLAARPRGTNEERKKRKPPVSRRKAIRQSVVDEAQEREDAALAAATPDYVEVDELVMTDTEYLAASVPAAQDNYSLPRFTFTPLVMSSLVVSARVTKRPTRDEHFLNIARETAKRTTCLRRAVGCVLVDARGHSLATGYNGVPKGRPHCNEGHACPGANMPSGQGLSDCLSVHAEINGLLQCPNVDDIQTVYLTVSPCRDCIKAIMNTGATRIVFAEEYVQPEAKELWLSIEGNEWIKL